MRIFAFCGVAFGLIALFLSAFIGAPSARLATIASGTSFAVIAYIAFKISATADAENQRREIIDLLSKN